MTDWTLRVAELRDLASDSLVEGDFEVALARVGEAFTIVDAEGNQQHTVFASLLCVAADLAVMSEDYDSGRSLYQRAHQVAASTQSDGALIAKALVGLGSLAEADGDTGKAADCYKSAIAALASSSHEDAEVAREAIREALQRVSA